MAPELFISEITSVDSIGAASVLVLLGGGIVKWLLSDRATLLTALTQALDRERALRDKRTDELTSTTKALSDSRDAIIDELKRKLREKSD